MMTQQKAPKLPQRAYIKITNLQYNVVRIRKSKYIMSQTSVPLNEKKKTKHGYITLRIIHRLTQRVTSKPFTTTQCEAFIHVAHVPLI